MCFALAAARPAVRGAVAVVPEVYSVQTFISLRLLTLSRSARAARAAPVDSMDYRHKSAVTPLPSAVALARLSTTRPTAGQDFLAVPVVEGLTLAASAGQDFQHSETVAGPVLAVPVAVVAVGARLARRALPSSTVATAAQEHQTLSPAHRSLVAAAVQVAGALLPVVRAVLAVPVAVVPGLVPVLAQQAQRTLVPVAVGVVSTPAPAALVAQES